MGKHHNSFFQFSCRVTAAAVLFLTPSFVIAQNCALCYTQAAGSGSRVIQALRSGIIILVLPPMLIGLGLAYMTYKKRNQFNED